MAIELANTPNYEFKNNKLRQFTEQIFKQGLNIKKAYARIAVTLAKIEESQCYEMDGFESTSDYAQKVLGIGYTQSRQFIRIGRDFIDAKSLESVLPHEEGNDYTTTQIQALLPLGSVMWAQEVAEDGTVSPDMTVKEIKTVVKDLLDKDKKDDVIEVENIAEDKEEVTEEETVTDITWNKTIQLGTDKQGNVYVQVNYILSDIEKAFEIVSEWHDKAVQ